MSGGDTDGVTVSPIAHGLIDGSGRLVAADPALVTLNARAGGAVGAAMAVPQIATLARLARRLGITVSRSVVVADADTDIDLWVRAQPEGDGVRLAVGGWRERQAWRPAPDRGHARADFVRADAVWRWETDAGLRLTFVSLAAGPLHGFDALAMLGRPLTELFASDAEEDGALPILGAIAARQAMTGQPARLRPSDQAVLLDATIRRDGAGGFAGFVGGVRMTEEEPVATTAAVDFLSPGFTTGVDRALRRPLARIVANADSISAQADGPIAGDYADYAADIAGAGRHLLALVDDLVDLQAIERDGFTLPADDIDLADLARRAAGLFSVRAGDAGVMVLSPAGDGRAWARGDFRRALQILVNLVGNAVRYSARGTSVRLELGRRDGFATLTVIDSGRGVRVEDQDRIFAKFERIDPSEPGGSGLGLYIARRLARAMGGDLTVESAAGEGARFTLALPAAAETPSHQDQ